MNYYRRFVGDYMRDTMDLSLLEHGAYTVLLDAYYATKKPFSADFESLFRMCRAMSKAERDAVKKVAELFFPIASDGCRHNGRADEEIQAAQDVIEKQRVSGAKAAAKRWSKSTDGSTQCEADRSTHGSTHRSTGGSAMQPPTTIYKTLTTSSPDGFLRFWDSWPQTQRKQGRAKCLQLWRRLRCEDVVDDILAHVEALKRSDSWLNGYDPMPATYLNQRRWDGATLTPQSSQRVAI